jgi:hypothetical protein
MDNRMQWSIIFILLFSIQCGFCQWENAFLDTLAGDTSDEHISSHAFVQSPDGTLHVTWYGTDSTGLSFSKYMRRIPNNQWSSPEEVTSGTSTGIETSLPKDVRPDSVWMVARSGFSLLFLQRGPTGEWTVLPVTPFEVLVASAIISPAVDPQGRWHVVFVGEHLTEYDLWYGLYQEPAWQWQSLDAPLGPYGSGAAPELVVDDEGIAHILYRAADGMTYLIYHSYNDAPGGTNWQTDILWNNNAGNYTTSAIWSREYGICAAISGNDGWGMPSHIYYHRKPVESGWLPPELATGTYSGTNGVIAIDSEGHPLIVWEQVSGNILTGNIFYAYNVNQWENLPLFENEVSLDPLVVMDAQDNGCLVFSHNPYPDDEDIYFFGPESHTLVPSSVNQPFPYRPYLQAICPNPTNSGGVIQFSLPARESIQLDLYNLLGQRIQTLASGYFNAGVHQLTFGNLQIASGWYLVTLDTPNSRQTQRLIILK